MADPVTRRGFIAGGIAASTMARVAGAEPAPAVHVAPKGSARPRLGSGEHVYEVIHGWGELPDNVAWHTTHGVAVDEAGQVYIKQRGEGEPADTILVFDADGRFVRSFGREYHGGGHGIDIRKEGHEEFCYLCDSKHGLVAKTTLRGEPVWTLTAPAESGKYAAGEPFRPTNVAFHPDGGFWVADGYGSHYVHRHDRDGKYLATIGGKGTGDGQFSTPHGIWFDARPGREPELVVADRANARLQYFSPEGRFRRIVAGVSFPAHFDTRGGILLIPDLHARVSLFGADDQPIVHLGDDAAWTRQVLADSMKLRTEPARWEAGRFVHPHDACFDADGNIFVVEWVTTGRVTKLLRLT